MVLIKFSLPPRIFAAVAIIRNTFFKLDELAIFWGTLHLKMRYFVFRGSSSVSFKRPVHKLHTSLIKCKYTSSFKRRVASWGRIK